MNRSDPAGDVQSYDVSIVNQLISPPGYIYIETTGAVEVVCASSDRTITIPGLLGGVVHPLLVQQVNAAGTAANTVYIWRSGR